MSDKNTLLVIDGYGFIFRAYHVLPPLTSPEGAPVGALYGFASMLLKVLGDFKPAHAVVVFDAAGPKFRHQIYPEYKANRPPVPQDLIEQLGLVHTVATNLNFPTMEVAGYEADDLIATLAYKAEALQENVIIISSDKDLMQLISDNVKMYDPMKNKYISEEDVIEKFGVKPAKVREVLALIGDRSDNVPGVHSIGVKTAAKLVNQFGSVAELLGSLDQITSAKQKEVLTTGRDLALISWQLVGLDHNVDIELDFDKLTWTTPDIDKLAEFLYKYGFKSLTKRVEALFQVSLNAPPAAEISAEIAVQTISNPQQFAEVINKAVLTGEIAIYLVPHKEQVVALGLAIGSSCYVIEISEAQEAQAEVHDLFSYSNAKQATANYWFMTQLLELLQNQAVKKISYNLKALLKFIREASSSKFTTAFSIEDLALMHYCLSAGSGKQEFWHEQLQLAHKNAKRQEVIDSTMPLIASFQSHYIALVTALQKNSALHLYRDIDLPLCYILDQMENDGVKLDLSHLAQLSSEFGLEINQLEKEIFAICGVEFNIASPKQLGEVLFEKMQLPLGKLSSKSNSYSTGAEILEKLSEQGHIVADLLLKWRQLTKLKNTYTDTLPKEVNPKTGRVHTTFLQNSTTTGRLSSQNPNLQNIPIRSKEGNKIRAAFIAEPSNLLVSADYSQIELRILSHIADIQSLKIAFSKGEDIHTNTACRIFGVPQNEVTPEHRRKAKAINFGIIYGISAFGLAKQLNIPSSEAASYIKRYFEEFPGIKEYMERTKEFARTHGYVKNLLGRKCFVPTINDKNAILRQFAERAAINAPLQGTNADIIKIAMINVSRKLQEQSLKTKMLLQIHDELLFEVPSSEIEVVLPLIKKTMENAINLTVPLIVEAKAGKNWLEIH